VNKDGENVGIEDPTAPNHLMSAARYALSMFAGEQSMYDPERKARERIEIAVTRQRMTRNAAR
jgi:hypothetical protein